MVTFITAKPSSGVWASDAPGDVSTVTANRALEAADRPLEKSTQDWSKEQEERFRNALCAAAQRKLVSALGRKQTLASFARARAYRQ